MIAARLAGGNLFLAFFGGGFWEHSEHSEHSDDFSGGWGVFWIESVGKN